MDLHGIVEVVLHYDGSDLTTHNNGFILPLFSTVIKKNPQGVQFRCPIYKKCKIVKPLLETVMMMIISKSKLMIIFNVLFQYKVFPLIHLKTVNFLLPVCLDMQYFMGMVNYSFFWMLWMWSLLNHIFFTSRYKKTIRHESDSGLAQVFLYMADYYKSSP